MLRTAQTSFPGLVDAKFALTRRYRHFRGIPFDPDFDALGLFPNQDGAVFLDVGANRGQSADAILLKTSNSRIELFEPNPELAGKLSRQFRNYDRIIVNNFGLSDENGEMILHVPYYKSWMFDGLASFGREEAAGWLEGRVFFYRPEHVSLREIKCKVRRLDEMKLRPFFIKIDVQGHEFNVLRGGEATLKKCQPLLLIETPAQEVIDYLRAMQYESFAFSNGHFFGAKLGSNNTFFMTPSKSDMVKNHIIWPG